MARADWFHAPALPTLVQARLHDTFQDAASKAVPSARSHRGVPCAACMLHAGWQDGQHVLTLAAHASLACSLAHRTPLAAHVACCTSAGHAHDWLQGSRAAWCVSTSPETMGWVWWGGGWEGVWGVLSCQVCTAYHWGNPLTPCDPCRADQLAPPHCHCA